MTLCFPYPLLRSIIPIQITHPLPPPLLAFLTLLLLPTAPYESAKSKGKLPRPKITLEGVEVGRTVLGMRMSEYATSLEVSQTLPSFLFFPHPSSQLPLLRPPYLPPDSNVLLSLTPPPPIFPSLLPSQHDLSLLSSGALSSERLNAAIVVRAGEKNVLSECLKLLEIEEQRLKVEEANGGPPEKKSSSGSAKRKLLGGSGGSSKKKIR